MNIGLFTANVGAKRLVLAIDLAILKEKTASSLQRDRCLG